MNVPFLAWFGSVALIVLTLPFVDAWQRGRALVHADIMDDHHRAAYEAAVADASRNGPLSGPLPTVRPTPYKRGPIREIEAQRYVQPPEPARADRLVELFREDDARYRAIRSGLPLGTPNEHAVTLEIMRRLDALAPGWKAGAA